MHLLSRFSGFFEGVSPDENVGELLDTFYLMSNFRALALPRALKPQEVKTFSFPRTHRPFRHFN